jgi:hypothetical protein
MKHALIALTAVMAIAVSTGQAAAQYDYGPEEEGAEESPFPDPDVVPDDSKAELEQIEAIDGTEVKTEPVEPKAERKRRGCEVDPASSTSSQGPIMALLFSIGLIAFRRKRPASRRTAP